MKSNKVSFIIPVYNAEKYLEECIKSILNQTIQDWELLLVDDGSPDKSGYICDEYAKHDSRIRVFHKKNGGVSSARNLALRYVTGDWVTFIDADDCVSAFYLEKCLAETIDNDIDIVQVSITKVFGDLDKKSGIKTKKCDVFDYLQTEKYRTSVCGGIIRSSLFLKNKLEFDQNLKLAEDQKCMFTCMALSHKLIRIEDILYYYRPNIGGATSQQKTCDLLLSIKELVTLKKQYPVLNRAVDLSLATMICILIKNRDLSLYKIRKLYIESNICRQGSLLTKSATRLQKMACYNIYLSLMFYLISVIKVKIKHKFIK